MCECVSVCVSVSVSVCMCDLVSGWVGECGSDCQHLRQSVQRSDLDTMVYPSVSVTRVCPSASVTRVCPVVEGVGGRERKKEREKERESER